MSKALWDGIFLGNVFGGDSRRWAGDARARLMLEIATRVRGNGSE